MPKTKSNRSAKKRFSFTAQGHIRRAHAYKRHKLSIKTRKRKRGLRQSTLVSAGDSRRMKRLLLI